jgi:hypothetical protein
MASECGSSIISDALTLLYDHEPYETFKEKVLGLMLQLYPQNIPSDIAVEKLEGR